MGRAGSAILAGAGALLLACGGEELVSARGDIEVTPRQLDFGAAWVGERVEGTLVFANDGRAPATVGLRGPGAPFELPASVEVPAAGEAPVKVGFRPLVAGDARGEVKVHVEGAGADRLVSLRGEGESAEISHPGRLDFGPVPVGERRVLPLALGNETTRDIVDLRVTVSGSDEAHFAVVGDLAELPAQSTGELWLAFEPGLLRSYRALLAISACEGCPTVGVELLGRGGESLVTASPSLLDFGALVPGTSRERTLLLRNRGETVARLREVRIEGHGFSAPRTLAVDLDGREKFELPIRFSPWEVGDREATLAVFDDEGAVVAEARLRGRGADVELVATPAAIDLDLVPLGHGASARLIVTHAGEPLPVQLTGATIEGGPGWAVSGPNFPAGVGSEGVEVAVDFTATTLGRSEATLVLTTNLPRQPELFVSLVARVARDEDCKLAVPWSYRFGLVRSGRTHQRSAVLKNIGGRDCMVWGFELDPAGSGRFFLPDPDGDAVIISDETLEIPIAFAAEVPSPEVFTTTLRFRTSDFGKPVVEVAVSAYAPGIEVYAEPEPLDFGVVALERHRNASTWLVNRSLLELTYLSSWISHSTPGLYDPPSTNAEYRFWEIEYPQRGERIDDSGAEFSLDFVPREEGLLQEYLAMYFEEEPEPVVVRLRGVGTGGPCGDDCEPPVAICPEPFTGPVGQPVVLVGSGVDPQGDPVTCWWRSIDSIQHPMPRDSCEPTLFPTVERVYTLRLRVRDPERNIGECTTTFTATTPPAPRGLQVEHRPGKLFLFHSAGGVPDAGDWRTSPFVCSASNCLHDWDRPGVVADDPFFVPNASQAKSTIRIDSPTPFVEYHVATISTGPDPLVTDVYCNGSLVAHEVTVVPGDGETYRTWEGSIRFDDSGGCTWTRVGSVRAEP